MSQGELSGVSCSVDLPGSGGPGPRSDEEVGKGFISALVARDRARLEACLDPEVHLRALLPRGLREESGPGPIAGLFLSWFGEAAVLETVAQESQPVAGRLHIGYRFRERYADGDVELIEQAAFCDVHGGRIVAIDLVCTGHLTEEVRKAGSVHQFDAGEMGCGSGLPQEFRRRIAAIPVGASLEVTAHDPSAKEDLPSLARLLGHQVTSICTAENGSTIVTIERRS